MKRYTVGHPDRIKNCPDPDQPEITLYDLTHLPLYLRILDSQHAKASDDTVIEFLFPEIPKHFWQF